MKNLFDFTFALIGLLLFSPFMLLIAIWIVLDSKGGAIYKQTRVGRDERHFKLFKFRSMKNVKVDRKELTVGNDQRITKVGKIIRKTKLDELPQLWNIVLGDMSFVGPRPEVPQYVRLYNHEQKRVLSVRPGLTDPASLAFLDEAELLEKAENPVEYYIEEIMPKKLKMNVEYLEKRNFFTDIFLIGKTLMKLF